MMLCGLLLLYTFAAAEPNHYFHDKSTNGGVRVHISDGEVKFLEPQPKNIPPGFHWSPVKTKEVRGFKKRYTSLDLHGRNITGFKDNWCNPGRYTFDELDLSHNKIAVMTREMLNQLPPSIKSVQLTTNKIQRLRNGVLDNPYLISLDLASNYIREIESKALAELSHLKFLYLQDNYLHDTKFAPGLPRSLETLQLNSNAIKEISAHSFMWLDSLQNLYLAHNKITEIHQRTFYGLVHLVTLNLSDNPIERVESRSFEFTSLLNRIVLQDWQGTNLKDVDFLQLTVKNKPFIILSA